MMYLTIAATVIGTVCMLTALLDMGMNGSRYADWAPKGLAIAFVCFIFLWVVRVQ